MKVTLIQGDDFIASRNCLSDLITSYKSKKFEMIKLNETAHLGFSEMIIGNLFNRDNVYVLENLNLSSSKDIITKIIKIYPGDLIIWQKGILSKGILSKLPKDTKILQFVIPKIIFKFLDSFYPGNTLDCIRLLHEIIKRDPPELVFSILLRHIRDMFWVLNDPTTLQLADWRLSKLRNQAHKWTLKKLREIIRSMANADIASKTSFIALSISLDIIIATSLE